MKRNNIQNKTFHSLINKLGINAEDKRDMILTITQGRETSSAGLTMEECQALINDMRVKSGLKALPVKFAGSIAANKMRRKILSICHEMRWTIDDKVDMRRLDTWLKKYGMFHIGLNDLSEAQLPEQITQFEQLLTSFYAQREIQVQADTTGSAGNH